MDAFLTALERNDVKKDSLSRKQLTVLQVNMGNLCNQSCSHCHIAASPVGNKIMSKRVVDDIIAFLKRYKIATLDITGGAPELNPHFDYLIVSARSIVDEVIVRSNLTVFFEPDKEYLPAFFKKHRVHLICSLPCYMEANVDSQRGQGVFAKSIRALQILNKQGFTREEELILDLAHNPTGVSLLPEQERLQKNYKRILNENYGIQFNRLITITNIPLKRFKDYLKSRGEYEKYFKLLQDNFNPSVLENLMCRSQISVGWDGRLYDCDFNLAIELELKDEPGKTLTIDCLKANELAGKTISFTEHCFACTAGAGSSCQGALSSPREEKIRDSVKYFYQDAARQPQKELCCPGSYEGDDLSFIPKEVLATAYGCGSPISLALPRAGETVVDLGCGAGIDCFIAAKKVDITGKVIGIDMTGEMLAKASRASEAVARNLGFLNCEFRQGFLEDIPVESESVDLVTSNCVINLSPDKSQVFAEIYRILKDGGRFVISDIVADREVPAYMRDNQKLWGECISGALTQNEFLTKAREAGFYGLEILKNFKYRQVEGIQFCSVTVRSYKLTKGKDCLYIGQYASYIGPYAQVHDDDQHIFPRGVPVEICTDTANKLNKKPYAGQFIITEVKKDGRPNPCCAQNGEGDAC